MGIVAPISAAPRSFRSPSTGARLSAGLLQWLGVALVLGGIVALAREPSPLASGSRRSRLALVAALCFGLFIVGIDAGSDVSAPWSVVSARGASVILVVAVALVTSRSLRPTRSALPMLVGIGVFDTGANVLIAFATTKGAAGIVAVLSALYPIVTIVLARMLLGERLSAGKRVGGAIALTGAVLVAAA